MNNHSVKEMRKRNLDRIHKLALMMNEARDYKPTKRKGCKND